LAEQEEEQIKKIRVHGNLQDIRRIRMYQNMYNAELMVRGNGRKMKEKEEKGPTS